MYPQVWKLSKIRVSLCIKNIFLICSLIVTLLGSTIAGKVRAQGPCGDTYIVLPGDTLSEIADLCGTEVGAILDLNPEITDPEEIFSGQIIRIPRIEVFSGPVVAITPECGLPGTPLTVLGSGYPPVVSVQITAGQVNKTPSVSIITSSDEFGQIEATITVPASATGESTWIVIAEASVSSAKFLGRSNDFSLIEPVPNPNAATTYESLAGDTLAGIALKFNREAAAISRANTGFSEAVSIPPGQVISIPARERGYPATTLSPICGPPGTAISVIGDDFPPGVNVNLSAGEFLGAYQPVQAVRVDPDRTYQTDFEIPIVAQNGDHWVILSISESTPVLRSATNLFSVIGPRDPNKQRVYFVQSGDSLNEIAELQHRPLTNLLAANPSITNPNQLEFGDWLIIPPQNETIVITPSSGSPGTEIQVNGSGFPPGASITLGLGRANSSFDILETIAVDAIGLFRTIGAIPPSARPGENWVVVSVRTTSAGSQAGITSNEFAVSRAVLPDEPQMTIWPLSGIPGTAVQIVAANFPTRSQVEYSLGRSELALEPVGSTWTDINGSFAIELLIPARAQIGNTWIFMAKTVDDPIVEATSPVFTVAEEEAP